ncbi:MATE family efflux transporter, partial [Stenotrophomonas sp. HMWF022]
VWGVLAMGISAVLVGVMRGSGFVLLPALAGAAAVLLLELPLAMWLQARHGLAGLWWAWPLGLLAMLLLQLLCFFGWRRRLAVRA